MTTNTPHDLGTPIAEYTPFRGTGCLISSLIVGILFSVFVTAVGIFIVSGYWWSGVSSSFSTVVGLMVVLLGVWLVARAIRKRNLGRRVLVFPEGLAYIQQGKTHIIRWENIAAVWQNVVSHYSRQAWQSTARYTGTIHSYTVELDDGRKYTFNDALGDVGELGRTIQQETSHYMLPRLRQAYEAGQTIPFGALGVSQAGISKGYKGYSVLPWDQVGIVGIYEGFLNVYSTEEQTITSLILSKGKKAWASVAVAKTPNVFVFKAMVDEILGSNK